MNDSIDFDGPLFGTMEERVGIAAVGYCFMFLSSDDPGLPFDYGSVIKMQIGG